MAEKKQGKKGKVARLDAIPTVSVVEAEVEVLDTPRNLGGRPSDYTQELADRICEQIVEGKSLRSICAEDDMPSVATIFNWHTTRPGFLEQYTRAKDNQADTNAERLQEISEKVLSGHYDPAAARVAADILKWSSAKLKPKKYGDKLDLTTDGKQLPSPIIAALPANTDDNKS